MTAQGLPCINPTCTHTFAHKEMQGVASLTCPKCGNVFQFGTEPAAPAPSKSQTPPPKAKPAIPKAKPAVAKAVPTKPVVAKAIPAKPVAAKPVVAKPVAAKPVAAKPVVAQPVVAKPAVAQPVAAKPPQAQTVMANPIAAPTATKVEANQIDVEPVASPQAKAAVATATPARPPQPAAGGNIVGASHAGYAGGSTNVFTRIIIVLGVLSLLGAGGYFISKLLPDGNSDSGYVPPDGKVYYGEIANTATGRNEDIFRVVVPKGVWELDLELRRQFKGAIAMNREVPNPDGGDPGVAWFAVAAHDYGSVKPRDSELLRQGIERLEEYFGDRIRMGQPKKGEFDKRPAQVMEFQGPGRNEVWWFGEMYTLSMNGIGYWIFVGGSGNLDKAKSVFAKLQETKGMGLFLHTNRKGWTAQPLPTSTYRAVGVPLKLSAPEKTWKNYTNPQAKHENGRLFLQSVRSKLNDPDKNIKAAELLVVSFDRATEDTKEAMKLAKEYVLQSKKAENEKFDMVPATDDTSELGSAKPVGQQVGRIGEWKLVNSDESFKKFLLIAVIRQKDRFYVFHCESFWKYHEVWRGEFYDILSTVRVLKK